MDFLEIRRKAKERAAARAAAAARARAAGAAGPGASAPGVAAPGGAEQGAAPPVPAQPRRPLRLDPLPLPPPHRDLPPELPAAAATAPGQAAPAPTEWAGTPDEPEQREPLDPAAVAEAARLEAELVARLQELPAAPDARFKTWRPRLDLASDLVPIAPGQEDDEWTGPARSGAPGGRSARGRQAREPAPALDPLEEFFYREDEPGPELGGLAAPAAGAGPAPELAARDEYLTFLLGSEEYGVEIGRVREVMRSPPITEVPRAPTDVLGVITVRGEVVPVFDPRRRLGLPRAPAIEGGRVVIVDDGSGSFGMLVDQVANVVRLPRGTIEPCPQGMGGASADCLEGIGRDGARIFTVLSVAALLRPALRAAEGRG